ncbi:hypothetical protein [Microbacterium sp. H1-D42]|uniref:hypothetical protein n=1 Tax=Microbacterium sp. H1-D42 TaxID=2925844 RepID=UPI001F531DD7|nr:hypothetical protein [Microbacterium sp. H1-D42]UNK71149.1 hypothetical protein MNR00_01495 [Microbacterium sp. H1-D42]
MRELAGRLSALDPEASETLRVIEYFDTLVDGRVGSEGMLRGAAVLSGAPIGYRSSAASPARVFETDQSKPRDGSPEGWPSMRLSDDAVVWIERLVLLANDGMILERLAISLSIISRRLDTSAPTRRAVEALLSSDADADEREQAVAHLAFPTHALVRAVAMPPAVTLERTLPHAITATRFGVVRAVLLHDGAVPGARAGIGIVAESPLDLRESWRSALIALRLADAQSPVVRADDLGVLLSVADAEDQRPSAHADVAALEKMLESGWSEAVLRGIAAGASIRSLASTAGIHHSSMDGRLQKLPETLGYNPMLPSGRTRLDVALMLHRLAHVRFDADA